MIERILFNTFAGLIALSFSATGVSVESLPASESPSVNSGVTTLSPEESRRRLNDALRLYEHGKTDAAIYMLQQLEQADPTNFELLLKLGEIAIDAKNWAYAIQVLRSASYLRPIDIDIRRILMDVYKAYQMPIQEIVVTKEILAINPRHIIANKRLAELYREQSMRRDEIKIRRRLKRLVPGDYANLKRLAMIFDDGGQYWEATKVYEQIREYDPDKLEDMQRLASLYNKLGEGFRQAAVLDHIAKRGGAEGWQERSAETTLRRQNRTFDPTLGGIILKTETEPTMEINSVSSRVGYTRIRVRTLLDFGVVAKYSHLNHKGTDLLDGNMDIDSTSFLFNATYHWRDKFIDLDAAVGFVHEKVSGRLFGRVPGVTADDFPFLQDPSFNSYGGTIPIGRVQLTARPWVNTSFNLSYDHNLVEDLDARLSLFTYDRISGNASYKANDKTELFARIDNSFISDGNYRFHALASGYYTLWGSAAKTDYRGTRQDFLRFLPGHFVRLGYEFEYFNDNRGARAGKYETFLNPESRHKGVILGQSRFYSFPSMEQILGSVRFSYGAGTTREFQRNVSARVFYYNPVFENQIGISYSYEDEESSNTTIANRRIAGFSKAHQFSIDFKWQF